MQKGCCSELSLLLAQQAPLPLPPQRVRVLAPKHLGGPLLNSLQFYLHPTFFFLMDIIFRIWSKKCWTERVNHFPPSAGSAPAGTAQAVVKPSLLPGPLLACVQLTVPQGTQDLFAELFPCGYSFLGVRLGHPTLVCPMNIQSELPFKSPWDLLVLNTRVFASFQTKLISIRSDIPITTHAHWQYS